MDDITSAILDAWQTIGPKLKANPLELAKRLARRRMKTLRRPMRAWCLAVRASDQRINPATAMCCPDDACYPGHPGLFREHDVVLSARLLRKICRPVVLERPGVDWKTAAKMLGCHQNNLVNGIRRGWLKANYIKGLSGQFGKPIPIIWAAYPLDPSSWRVGEEPDPVWGAMWQYLADMVPDELEQTVTRVPRLGVYDGHSVLRGWNWICPACRKQVKKIYYPIAPINLPEFFKIDPASNEWDQIEKPPATFACWHCHGVLTFSRIDKNSWNLLVHHASGGLLYGYEVKRPAWLTRDRKKRFKSLINRAPSQRREEVLERLLLGWKHRLIAKDLGISYHRTRNLVSMVLKQHRVHSRKQLQELLTAESRRTQRQSRELSAISASRR